MIIYCLVIQFITAHIYLICPIEYDLAIMRWFQMYPLWNINAIPQNEKFSLDSGGK